MTAAALDRPTASAPEERTHPAASPVETSLATAVTRALAQAGSGQVGSGQVGSGAVVVVTDDDDATARATAEVARAGGGARLEGLRTTTSPVLRRAVLDRVALGQVDVVVVSAGAWDPAELPDVALVDARTTPPPVPGRRPVLCRLGAR
ncbi:hypothetical protein N866_04200 [Actinotalea ferrariae CF5-4]|uniref:Uncharacterized protein n=1 Tax=Actinotalea ferrariae CF5-4 TaxID=948458 RepID=A0A021VP54_9CELL|nr:hypothetical protein [Actinotalea ferrariae]EYR62931.1 hypothetical protein N866_04200 [Actinotalea ferrariae CF5-4]